MGSLRNTRRQGGSLVEQARAASDAIFKHTENGAIEGFVTGLIGRLELHTGSLALVNAGHIAPYLARAGAVTPVELPAQLPLGMFSDAAFRAVELILEPGDRFILVTDGMPEHGAASLDLVGEINETRSLHPRETTRRLADNVLAVTEPVLADKATLFVLDWHGRRGRPGGDRNTIAGADSTARD